MAVVEFFTKDELGEDSRDFIAQYLIKTTSNLSFSGQQFAALYLLSHGVIKFLMVWGLYKRKLWAYPASIVVFSIFIVYQMYRYAYTHSIWLILFSLFDIAVIWLTLHEYSRVKLKAK